MILEQNYIGGREVVRNQDGVFGAFAQFFRHCAALAGQGGYDALGHLAHIGLAFAEVFVLHIGKLCKQFIELQFQRPFGVAGFAPDDFPRRVGEGIVL